MDQDHFLSLSYTYTHTQTVGHHYSHFLKNENKSELVTDKW